MDELKFNKIAAGVLCGLLLIMVGVKVADVLRPDHDERAGNAYPIEGAESSQGTSAAASKEGPEPILALLADADLTAGEKVAKKCTACHSFNQGGPTKIGPNLWEIVNAPAAKADFAYSEAMANLEADWSYTNLNGFLYKPKEWLKGTKMNFVGLKKTKDRANIIAWLRSLSAAPADLPSAEEIAAEVEPSEEPASDDSASQDSDS